jgi:hypothetical protein
MPGEGVDAARGADAADAVAARVAGRLRDAAAEVAPPPTEPLSAYAVERWLDGDAGHLHRAADLRTVPIASHRALAGRAVVAAKRATRRLLYPLLDVQSGVNAANARVVTFLLRQLAAQAERIDELQREVAELRAERER